MFSDKNEKVHIYTIITTIFIRALHETNNSNLKELQDTYDEIRRKTKNHW